MTTHAQFLFFLVFATQQVIVGYMRRYAPAFVQATEQVRALGKINYARVRDIIGQNAQFVEQSSVVLRPKDIFQQAVQDRAERVSRLVKEAIGEADTPIGANVSVHEHPHQTRDLARGPMVPNCFTSSDS
jgi:hypothetical protein